jgi:aryl-alcohol dehydrogenase-like predicted oxidoreductase
LFGDGVETIDVYQLHVYDSEVPVEEYPWLMNELIYAGKIRAYGVSNYPAEALQELLAACDRDALPRPVTSQPFLNIVQGVQDTEHLAQSEGMTTLAHSPLLKGLLVDGMVDDLTQMTQGNSLPEVQGFKQGLDGLGQLQGYAKERELTLAQLAIAWVTSQPNTIALSACTSERYLTDAITGASHQLDLEDEELKVICKSFDDLNFVDQAVQIMKQMKIYYR